MLAPLGSPFVLGTITLLLLYLRDSHSAINVHCRGLVAGYRVVLVVSLCSTHLDLARSTYLSLQWWMASAAVQPKKADDGCCQLIQADDVSRHIWTQNSGFRDS